MLSFLKSPKRILIVSLLILTTVQLAACGVATPTPVATATSITAVGTPNSQYLDTPSLIRQALDRGEITEEERWLYLAYALYEYKSLPKQYLSSVGWFGEVVAEELDEVVNSPAKFCSMSPHIRSELLRLVKKTDVDTICN